MKKLLSAALAALLLGGLPACAPSDPPGGTEPPETEPPETEASAEAAECETAWEFMENFRVGWNLGLAMSFYTTGEDPFSALSPEERVAAAQTMWGNPLTTQEMIDAVRDRGFNLIRVQVSYLNHMDGEGNVDPLWLDRVVEIVDYCMNAGVYCLLTSTGAGWLTAERDTFPEQSAVFRRMWEQIAARFTGHGSLLLFEAVNEVLNAEGAWWDPGREAYGVMNDLYQVFVDTVRAAGGCNATRNLVLTPYAATYDSSMNFYFRLPSDTAEGHLIAEVHCYDPVNFCFNEINLGSADFRNVWGTAAERARLDEILEGVKERFTDRYGIPAIVGEFGVVDRAPEEERAEYIGYYAKTADKYGIGLVLFDDGYDFAVFDRRTLTWRYDALIDALMTKGASVGE